jgi:hypothetical protein
VIGRRVEIIADLERVRVLCEGTVVADHDRLWARHQSVSDPAHVAAATTLRQQRIALLRPAPEPEVELRCLAEYDTACGLDDADDGVA